jgi:membrane protein
MRGSPFVRFWRALVRISRETYHLWQKNRLGLQAAGLAFYLALALGPLVLILTDAATLVVGPRLAAPDILDPLQPVIGSHATRIVEDLATSVIRRSQTALPSIFSVALLLVGSAGIFEQLKATLNAIWDLPASRRGGVVSVLKNRFLSVLLVAVYTLVILVLLTSSALVADANNAITQFAPFLGHSVDIGHPAASLLAMTLLIGVTFKVLPDTRVRWRDVWLGAFFTAVLFTAGQFLIGTFLARSGFETAYGRATAMVVVLVWLYYSAEIYLLGAAFTRACAERTDASRAGAARA